MIWILGGIASAMAVFFLYGARPMPQIDVVSTDRFFSTSGRSSSMSRLSLPKQHWLSLLLLIVLCLGLSALARSQAQREAQEEVIVVDLSASMGAGERVEDAAAVLASRWGRGPLLGAAETVFLLHGKGVDPNGPLDILRSRTPKGEGIGSKELIAQAQAMVPTRPIYVITDRPPPSPLPDTVTWHQVGTPNPSVGIIRATAERTDTLGTVRSTVVVSQHGSNDELTVGLRWHDGQQTYASKQVDAAGKMPIAVTSEFVMPDSGEIEVTLTTSVADGWRTDNQARVSVGSIQPIVVSGSEISPFWIAAFQAHPNVTWISEHPNPDLYITDIQRPEVPEASRYLFVGEAVGTLGMSRWNALPQWDWAAPNTPLLAYADMRSLNVRGVWELEWPSSTPLVRTTEGTVVSMGTWRERPALAWGIELAATDAALRTQFVNWVANVVQWSATETAMQSTVQGNPLSDVETFEVSVGVANDTRPWPWLLIWQCVVFGLAVLWAIDTALWGRRWTRAAGYVWVLRCSVFAILFMLAWLPWGAFFSPEPMRIHIVDRSKSMGLMDAVEHSATVRFPETSHGEAGSPLEPALRRALARIPAGVSGEIILHSDGRWTDYAWDVEDIEQYVAPHEIQFRQRQSHPFTASCTIASPWVRAGEVVRVLMVSDSAFDADAMQWTLNDAGVVPNTHSTRVLKTGMTETEFVLQVPLQIQQGPVTLTGQLQGVNGCVAGLVVRSAQRLWMVSDDVTTLFPMRDALIGSGFDIVMATPQQMRDVDMAQVDLVVLGSAVYEAGNALDQWLPRVRTAVEEGMGLFTVGGAQSYDSGRWGLTELRDMVPLALETEEDALDGAVSFLAILDKSGSMAFDAGNRPRMAWANAGTLAAIGHLRSTDRAGVLAVDDALHWNQAMRPVGDGSAFDTVRDIRGGKGGILVYSSLVAAQTVMEKERSPVRHVVLFADAQDAEEKVKGQLFGWGPGPSALDIAKEMSNSGVTLSVVAIGDPRDQDVAFLELLTSVGNGRFHITKNAQDLVGLFTQETQRLVKKRTLEGELTLVALERAPFLEGIQANPIPPLRTLNRVQPRPAVRPFVQTESGAPVLASWRVGLGRVTAFTGAGGSVKDWETWSENATFWRQSMRWAAQPELDVRSDLYLRRTPVADVAVTRPLTHEGSGLPMATLGDGAARPMWPDRFQRWMIHHSHARHRAVPPQRIQVQWSDVARTPRWIPGLFPQEFAPPEGVPKPSRGTEQAVQQSHYVRTWWPVWVTLLWILIPLNVWSQRDVRS